ncbi:hypothetical protein [Ochrobactrum soli]|uniref:Uncharacterized protein n=1 Tax=Ochrobactrum soli TaxID=2448455 RepID=A0A849KVI7_9HYPH|nr:hypothetical protein [[Ochrobactrum] soli]NNU62939.1 hypothetical protein [[Ochrobactrum] soli]
MKFLRLLRRISQEKTGTMDTASVIKDSDRFYESVFAKVEKYFGVSLDPDTISSIIGFSAGGPVSLRANQQKRFYLTRELAMYEAQLPSSDGALRYEFMTEGHFSEETARTLLTALGNLTQNSILGKGHTIDLTSVFGSVEPFIVRLDLAKWFSFEKKNFAIYRVVPIN